MVDKVFNTLIYIALFGTFTLMCLGLWEVITEWLGF